MKRIISHLGVDNKLIQDTFHFGTRDAQTQCSLDDCKIDLNLASRMSIPKDAECLNPAR